MGGADLYLFITSLIFIHLAPGRDRLFVLHQTLMGKLKAGLAASLGICVSTVLTILICLVFIRATVNVANFLFFIRLFGSIFLVILGLRYCLFSQPSDYLVAGARNRQLSIFMQAFFVHLSNPMAFIFPLTFYPQFLTTPSMLLQEFAVLGTIATLTGLIFNIAFAAVINPASIHVQRKRPSQSLRLITGLVFIIIAFKTIIQ